jgi:hypothetical protein
MLLILLPGASKFKPKAPAAARSFYLAIEHPVLYQPQQGKTWVRNDRLCQNLPASFSHEPTGVAGGQNCFLHGQMDTDQLPGSTGLLAGLTSGTLFASLIWGSIGLGFFIYGKKQRSFPPLLGGLAMMGICYFISSVLWMSIAAVAIIAGIWFWSRYD